ncbi:MAG: aspartate--tRNA ligase, partial [Fibrobacterales bacterium]|nr:aspartate--tRNA ligase [Fibrobacterales bacterium]
MKRTHHCSQLRKEDSGKTVTLAGWIDRRRDHGGIIFIDLRDKHGITQVVFNPDHDAALHAQADALRNEWVVSVVGKVRPRPDDMVNPNRETGEIEVLADGLTVLNKSETSPLVMNDFTETSREGEDIRFRYRYLDLRRPWVQKNLLLKSRFLAATRRWFEANGFEDVETPVLCKSTPEGARDYLVPSRIHPGEFYALPQSPQTYKQLLMIAGFDRYYQIAKCFRDEDLRADRQPEFTQIDAEMSFVESPDVRETFDDYVKTVFGEVWPELMKQVSFPLPTMTWHEAMLKYGSDKPDLRIDWEIADCTDLVKDCGFAVFRNVAANGGVIRGLAAKGCVDLTRKAIDDLTAYVGRYGAKGLVWMRMKEGDEVETQVAKFFKPEELVALRDRTGAKAGDMMFFIAADEKTAATAMGQLRLEVARQKNLLDPKVMKMLWVIDFPMFEWSDTEKRYMAMHHPFTAPVPEDLHK